MLYFCNIFLSLSHSYSLPFILSHDLLLQLFVLHLDVPQYLRFNMPKRKGVSLFSSKTALFWIFLFLLTISPGLQAYLEAILDSPAIFPFSPTHQPVFHSLSSSPHTVPVTMMLIRMIGISCYNKHVHLSDLTK